MTREEKARLLCEHHNVNPDQETVGIGRMMEEGRKYKLWEYFAEHYVDIVNPKVA